jgi:hypothetical protein
VAFVLERFGKEFFALIASGVRADGTGRPAMLVRGPALFSIHRPLVLRVEDDFKSGRQELFRSAV